MRTIGSLNRTIPEWFLRIMRPLFALRKKAAKPGYTYTVFVDDNYHYMDESERYTSGTFPSLKAAITDCKKIVDDFLEESRKGLQPTSDALYRHYVAFGPDPFIVTEDPSHPDVPFSAWTYAQQQCVRRYGNQETP